MSAIKQSAPPKRLILLGPPGAGKGTQAKFLADSLGVSHIASGDLFRYHQSEGTPLGLKATQYMNQGLLVPDEITIAMVLEQITDPEGSKLFLLDGFPRNLFQAHALDEALAAQGQTVDQAIYINLPIEESIKRLGKRLVCRECQAPYNGAAAPSNSSGVCEICGGELYQRQDDTPEAMRVRIKVYLQETEPLIEYYERCGRLVEVDGVGTVDEVGQRLLDRVRE